MVNAQTGRPILNIMGALLVARTFGHPVYASSGKKNKRAVVVQLMSAYVSLNKLYNNQKMAKLVLFSTAWLNGILIRAIFCGTR